MFSNNQILVDDVARSCMNVYVDLPKTGKPLENEWTVLSAVVKLDIKTKQIEVVSLGTGSKCIGATKMSSSGDLLNDSHAEVIARRGFIFYLYSQIEDTINDKPSVFKYENLKFKLKDNIEFLFYSSQLPCGDASIIPKSSDEHFGDILQTNKRHLDVEDEIENKKQKLENDIHRTGAKCLPNSAQDSKEAGYNYHLLGQVRTKPGRGDRTLSVSCSDKIARWVHCGINGALMDLLLEEPIYITHFIFSSGVPYCNETLTRAILIRYSNWTKGKLKVIPQFHQSLLKFPYIRCDTRIRPAPGSIIWIKQNQRLHEVAVQGKKLGVTKKNANCWSTALCISKYNLYRMFLKIISQDKCGELCKQLLGDCINKSVPYNEMKRKSNRYQKNWSLVREFFFKTWTVKPDMWRFCLDLSTAI